MLASAFYGLFGMNQKIFFIVNGVHSPLLDTLMIFGTELGSFWNMAWILLLALLLLLLPKLVPGVANARWFPERQTTLRCLSLLLVAYSVAALVVAAMKIGLHMPRPPAALPAGTVHVLDQPESPFSFPSGHAAFAMLVATVFWPYCRRGLKFVLIAVVAWVGISRVSLGVHFPSDVLMGYFCGAFSTWLAARLLALRGRESGDESRLPLA